MKTPRLIERIQKALAQLTFAYTGTLRVSVSKNMQWEELPDGRQVRVRWLCWSILDGITEVVSPEFDLASESVTRERLEAELPDIFSGLQVIVDHDIEVE